MSDSPGLVDFAIGLVNSVVKKFLGLVEMTPGLVNASISLPEWQAVKMIFFAPWTKYSLNVHFIVSLYENRAVAVINIVKK